MLDNWVQRVLSGWTNCPHCVASCSRALCSSAVQLSRTALSRLAAARHLPPTSSFGKSRATAVVGLMSCATGSAGGKEAFTQAATSGLLAVPGLEQDADRSVGKIAGVLRAPQ